MPDFPDPFSLIIALAALGLVPFLVVMVTSFAKLVIVFFLIRNALGIQQIPPNMVLYGLATILSVYIMAPVGQEIWNAVAEEDVLYEDTASFVAAAGKAREPFRAFLLKHTTNEELAFFFQATRNLWPEETMQEVTREHLIILIPAFTVSELTKAFEIGFLLYLPFIAIDLVVSNILLAMGMMMVSPLTISLPFKLFLFVLVDGWTRLVHGLVLSYG